MLRLLNLKNVYDSSESDLINELIIPLLKESILYRRGVGFFSSSWLRLASIGLTGLIENGGSAQIILSPNISKEDWDAIRKGEEAKENPVLLNSLKMAIIDLKISLERDTLNSLSWMIAEGFLNLKIAIPRKSTPYGMYHDKVAIFYDKFGDSVAIHGSLNDSMQASYNGEAFSVFKSWVDGQFEYWKNHDHRLEKLWNNENSQFIAMDLPQVIKEELASLRTSAIPPYKNDNKTRSRLSISIPLNLTLKPYQEEAIDKWFDNGCRGILEMATGTGKTITSLAAAVKVYQRNQRIFLVIIVPFLHLLEQWRNVANNFGFYPVLCGNSYSSWQEDLRTSIQNYNLGVSNNVCVIAVNKTAASYKFIEMIKSVRAGEIMIIGDEVHTLGSSQLKECMQLKYEYRLGLSATPRRWFDEHGTRLIFDYFGNTCYEFSLDRAISEGYLVPYKYHPILVNLTPEEHEKCEIINNKIIRLLNRNNMINDNIKNNRALKMLLIERSRIISGAQNKLSKLQEILGNIIEYNKKNEIETRDILIYCPPGHHKKILKQVSDMDLICHEFVSRVSANDRSKILKEFESGFYQALVAIKCLDEGLDIPSTKIAFIVASSSNPREFIQRRGRILRKAERKSEATIFDFIVVPNENMIIENNLTEIGIFKRELPRFAEFSSSAKNEFEAREIIWDIANRLGILPLLDKKPWEIYAENLANNLGESYEIYL